jgi:hypothetical protein
MAQVPQPPPHGSEDAQAFCQRICRETNRGQWHGEAHMQRVWENASDALQRAFLQPNADDVVLSDAGMSLLRTLCLTHDLCHYRMDTDGSICAKYDAWLASCGYGPDDVVQIHRLLVYASTTSELKMRERTHGRFVDWHKLFDKPVAQVQPEELVYIRQLLSEADKLDMLGADAVERCRTIVAERRPNLANKPAEIRSLVVEMYRADLASLPDLFESEQGYQFAVWRRDEMAAKLGLSSPIAIPKKQYH